MSEALVISAANLDIIERNLGDVAKELTGVISNVNSVNDQMNKVEEHVEILNDEVKGLVKEIRETTLISNARQSIMYNNSQIEKKYGYYDVVRRNTKAILNAIGNSNLSKKSLLNLRETVLLNNPDYWLTNALATVISWLLDDRNNYEKELKNTLAINEKKASLFFSYINLKYNRLDAAEKWLIKYLSDQDPSNLDGDFITVLDLVSTGIFGDDIKSQVLNKISKWSDRLNSIPNLIDNNIKRWEDYVSSKEIKDYYLPQLEIFSNTCDQLRNSLAITSSYNNIYNDLISITSQTHSNSNLNEIISNLIYDYEDNELVYQQDNLKNNLLISCNGDREQAERLFEKQKVIYDSKIDLLSLLTNVILYKESYNVSPETQKLALGLMKDNLLTAIDNVNKNIYNDEINIQIEDFQTKTKDGLNQSQINEEIDSFVEHKYKDDSKDLIAMLIAINILGIIGIFFTLTKPIFVLIILMILVIGNVLLIIKLSKKMSDQRTIKNSHKDILNNYVERVLAEVVDYYQIIDNNQAKLKELNVFLDKMNASDYLKNNHERNIEIGE